MTDSNKEQFTVQADRRYLHRDGRVVEVLFIGPEAWNDPYCLQCCNLGADKRANFWLKRSDLISEYKEPTAEPQDEWGPWIGWNGGECPVDEGTYGQLQLYDDRRRDVEEDEGVYDISSYDWDEGPQKSSIIAYRIKKAPEVKEYKVRYSPRRGGFFFLHAIGNYTDEKNAIITLTDGEPTIRWATEE